LAEETAKIIGKTKTMSTAEAICMQCVSLAFKVEAKVIFCEESIR